MLVARELYPFLPSLLGAITLYILLRQWYFRITIVHNWKKWLAATMSILASLLVFVLPFVLIVMLVAQKAAALMDNPSLLSGGISSITAQLQRHIPQLSLDESSIRDLFQRAVDNLPTFIGSTLHMLSNLMLCFFLLYFMLVSGRKMER